MDFHPHEPRVLVSLSRIPLLYLIPNLNLIPSPNLNHLQLLNQLPIPIPTPSST